MPRERKQRGHKHAEKRKLEKEEEEKKYLENQERDVLFYDRPKNPFGLLTREDEKFFGEVAEEFKKNEWDDQDAKEAFMRNVFVEMRGKELKVATSYVGRFLERLLAQCPRSEVQMLMTVFKGHNVELGRHRFGSYVLEKIVGHVGVWISKDIEGTVVKEEEETERLESIERLFSEMVEELLYPEISEQFTDPFASHVYQAILNTLNGQATKNLSEVPEEPKSKKRKLQAKEDILLQTPSSFATLREKLITVVKSWDQSQLQSLMFDKYAVPLLQAIIESDIPTKVTKVKKEKKSKSKKRDQTLANLILLGEDENHEDLVNRLLRDTVGSRIIETIIKVSSDQTIQLIWDTYFKDEDKLIELSQHVAANFALQRIFERLTKREDISSAVNTLLTESMDLICQSRISVVTSLLDACARTNTECQAARQAVYESIWREQASYSDLWLTLMDFDVIVRKLAANVPSEVKKAEQSTPHPVSRWGALLAASLLRLPGDDFYKMHQDFCEQETDAVLFYITCPQTSHVVEYMLNKQFPQRFRRKIINHILGSVVTLAKDAGGSHIIDACWQATHDMRYYREKMAKEMADQADVVRSDFFGRRVWRNWNMDGFVDARFDWGRMEGEQQERQFAKRPEVKEKKPWQKEVEKRASGVGKGIVTKHSARFKSG